MNDWERMIAGRLYNADDPVLGKRHFRDMALCDQLNRTPLKKTKKREKLLQKLIPSSKGQFLTIFTPFYCEYGENITVGKYCFANYNCVFLDVAPITLEDGVWIGANVTLATPMHPYLAEERLVQQYPDGFHDLEYAKPITIKKNTWICSGAIISGGVTVGENCIIAAGAVVTTDIPDNCIAAGVPAKVLREIDEDDRLNVWDTYQKNIPPVSPRKQRQGKK